jgi:hypothetical protein
MLSAFYLSKGSWVTGYVATRPVQGMASESSGLRPKAAPRVEVLVVDTHGFMLINTYLTFDLYQVVFEFLGYQVYLYKSHKVFRSLGGERRVDGHRADRLNRGHSNAVGVSSS